MAVEVDEFKGLFGGGNGKDFFGLEVEEGDAVEGDFDRVVVGEVLDAELFFGHEDDRAIRDGMGADRGQHEAFKVGSDDGTACRHRIGGRAVRSRDDDAVGGKGVDVSAVDMAGKVDKARVSGAVEDDFIHRKAFVAL